MGCINKIFYFFTGSSKMDADYFKWKDEQEEQEAAEEKEKSAGFQNKIKNLIGGHPHDDSGV